MNNLTRILCVLGVAGAVTDATAQREVKSTAADRESVAITVYNGNFGLVREVRQLSLGRGRVLLEYGDVAAQIQPETVYIKSLTGNQVSVLEQNYRYDLLSPQKLLEKYLGRTVKVYRYNSVTGRDDEVEAKVLSVNQGPILQIGNEITYNYPGRFSFPEIPENLIAEPTLMWMLDSRASSPDVEVSYLTQGLNWKSDYVLVVNEDDTQGDLTGWVTLTNQSGTTYENAQLKLVAGDVQRIQQRFDDLRARGAMMEMAQADASFTEQSFFEYHLYTLQRPTDLLQNEQKQVTLLEGSGIAIDKRLIFYGASYYYRGSYGQVASNQKVGVYLDFENSEDNNLGMALPKGVVRVYKADPSGAQQFIGEDQIDHTPRDEKLRIKMGEAFDVVGDRRQMDYTVISRCVSESTWEIELRNHKDEAAEVDVFEPVGGDWDLLSTSHEARKIDAHTFTYRVNVPARGDVTISYRVRVRWC